MKREAAFVFCLFMAILLLGQAMALTGSIGNARMVLRLEQGQEIEKYILVKNVNDVPLTINLTATGDLADYIKIKDNNFKLDPGKEKKAYFTIKAALSKTTTTSINVAFTPEEGSGVGLSSTIITLVENGTNSETEETDPQEQENDETGTAGKVITGFFSGFKLDSVSISLVITGIMLVIFIILIIVYFKKANKKGSQKQKREIKPKKDSEKE
jgi:hypothetical protein